MLLDNKTLNEQNIKTVFEFLNRFTEGGELDIVSGYFSISGLASLSVALNEVKKFRLILGDITEDKRLGAKTINLLSEDLTIASALQLRKEAHEAVEFLKRDEIIVKTVEPNFCHAKTYIYKDKDIRKCYYVLGSSNLTWAGMGLKASSNVELNTAKFSDDGDIKDVQKWFKQLWEHSARNYTLVENQKIPFKDFLIRIITDFFRNYTPLELYYKTLYEFFKDELPELEATSAFQEQIGHLKNTVLFNTLYPFQKKGVMSLIRMIQNYNGAILADAVGLGKTWQALAVMKFFQLQGYEIVLLCPKKLEQNWRKYKKGHQSKFEADRLDYTIRYHTDLQDDRLEKKQDGLKIKSYFQNNPKILFVIDESHNLRNDKSNRYDFLVKKLLHKNTDVKVLLLSATPINNHLTDIRNQFKLLARGDDGGFRHDPELAINSLQTLFGSAQKEFNIWQKVVGEKKIEELTSKLPPKIYDLTDKLIVARTRKIIESQTADLTFPTKLPPTNIYVEINNLGKLKSFASILDALKIYMTAYRPTEFTDASKAESVLDDNMQREMFLVKMMYILLVKRLESSWNAFDLTVGNIYNQHKNALDKVNLFLATKQDAAIEDNLSEIDEDDVEDAAKLVETQILGDDNPDNDNSNPLEATLGKKRKIKLSAIVKMGTFKEYLERDIRQLDFLRDNLNEFKKKFNRETSSEKSSDEKLQKLMQLIREKQKTENPKVVVFTSFKDTAQYLYDQLLLRGYKNVGLITGSYCKTDVKIKYRESDFEPLLEAFAPYTKLYLERDWSAYTETGRFDSFEAFKEAVSEKDKEVKTLLDNPIDILIATDCISEGQNLQDCNCVINYDIHWNPVRLIQRFGRIDRIGSPHTEIEGINFWPGKDYDGYLKLKGRVEDRMALFTIVGSEYDPQMTPELAAKVKDNPLISRQTENILKQLQTTWDDIEENEESFGFDKLSLEEYRQELFDYFNRHRDEMENIPNGVFTGFVARPDLFAQFFPKGMIALVRYKGETKQGKREHHLLYVDKNGSTDIINHHEILSILRKHKDEKRFVPDAIDTSDITALGDMAAMITKWMDNKAGRQAITEIQNLLDFGIEETPSVSEAEKSKGEVLLEDKFKNENFELITWFVVS